MERLSIPAKDAYMSRLVDEIVRGAMGNPIVFTATPTNATMRANSWGIYGTNLYVKDSAGNCIRIAGALI